MIKKRWKLDKDLVHAITENDLASATDALDKGAEPNHSIRRANGSKTTPLIFAATGSRVEIVELLLRRGANHALIDSEGMTAVHHARTASTLRLLLEAGADSMARTREGITPLHIVMDPESARLLVAYGADFRAENSEGVRPAEFLPLYLGSIRSKVSGWPELTAGGDEALAYLRALEDGRLLDTDTPAVSMTVEEEAAKAQTGRM